MVVLPNEAADREDARDLGRMFSLGESDSYGSPKLKCLNFKAYAGKAGSKKSGLQMKS